MDLVDAMVGVVKPFCAGVTVPEAAGCCGFAGDRGFLVPELAEAASRLETEEVTERSFDGYYSSSRTCEIGMTRATSMPYRSFWYLLQEASGRDGKGLRLCREATISGSRAFAGAGTFLRVEGGGWEGIRLQDNDVSSAARADGLGPGLASDLVVRDNGY